MKKRLLNILLMAAMMLQFVIVPVNAAEYIQDSADYKALVDMGMIQPITDEKLQMVDSISRGNFAEIMANLLMKGNPVPESTAQYFSDVIPGTNEANSIALVYEKNIMVGNPDGTFGVDMGITYREAVKTLVVLMGYEKQAELDGGYPGGYMRIGSSTGLTKGIAGVEEEFISYEQFFKLMLNLAKSPVMSIAFDSINNGRLTYTSDEDADFLSEFFDITYDKGIITANESTGFNGEKAGAGAVEINGEYFLTGESGAENYLGYYVKYYYHYDKDLKENVLDYIALDKKNDVVTVYSDQIDRVELVDQSRKIKLYYYLDDDALREEKLTVSNEVSVIKNSMYSDDFTVEDFMPESGSVTLIDNDGDTEYDVAFIETCDIILVDKVAEYYGYITDKYRKNADGTPYQINLDFDEPGMVTILKDGKEITPRDILAYDIAAVYKYQDNGDYIYKVVITRSKLEGTATNYNDGEVVINGEVYKLNKIYERYLKESGKTIPIGVTRTFYFDQSGFIAGMKETEQNNNYGFVRKVYVSETDDRVEMRVYTPQNDEWGTYRCSENVKIDGEKAESEGLLQLVQTLIRYDINSSGEISRIYIPEPMFEGSKNLMMNSYIGALGENNGNGTHYYFGSKSITLRVPKSESDYDNEAAYANKYSTWHQGKFDAELYDMNGYVIGVCIYRAPYSEATVSGLAKGVVVTRITESVNADDTPVAKIEGITEGYGEVSGILSETCSESSTFKSLKVGDIIRYATNAIGEIDAMEIDVRAEEAKISEFSSGSLHTGLAYYVGTVDSVDVENNIIGVSVNGYVHSLRIPGCIVINKGSGKDQFERAYAGDLREGQRVICRTRETHMQIIEILQ